MSEGLRTSKIKPGWHAMKHLNLHLYCMNEYNTCGNQPALGPRRCFRIPLLISDGQSEAPLRRPSQQLQHGSRTRTAHIVGVQFTKARASLAAAGPLSSGLRNQNPNSWRRDLTMARQLRKQPARNRSRSRLSSLSSHTSHISTGKPGVTPR
jgi:hypothetical protein